MRFYEDREMELWEHLSELRGRIVRVLLYLVVGAIAGWFLYPTVLKPLIERPLTPLIAKYHIVMAFKHLTGPFMLQLQVAVIAGLILVLPLLTLELWGFVAPGLTRDERKGFYFVVPLSLFFFFLGVATAYFILPSAFRYFASFLYPNPNSPLHTDLIQDPVLYWTFVMKMLLAFGVVFQLPVVLMFLAWIGLVTSTLLKKNWRHAIVGCSVLAAVATPSNDAPSMIMMGVPLIILYFASIWLVGIVERVRAKRQALAAGPSYEAS
jgi:sec-independent protein translocase protein TatC